MGARALKAAPKPGHFHTSAKPAPRVGNLGLTLTGGPSALFEKSVRCELRRLLGRARRCEASDFGLKQIDPLVQLIDRQGVERLADLVDRGRLAGLSKGICIVKISH